jgi:hypothetical protein
MYAKMEPASVLRTVAKLAFGDAIIRARAASKEHGVRFDGVLGRAVYPPKQACIAESFDIKISILNDTLANFTVSVRKLAR